MNDPDVDTWIASVSAHLGGGNEVVQLIGASAADGLASVSFAGAVKRRRHKSAGASRAGDRGAARGPTERSWTLCCRNGARTAHHLCSPMTTHMPPSTASNASLAHSLTCTTRSTRTFGIMSGDWVRCTPCKTKTRLYCALRMPAAAVIMQDSKHHSAQEEWRIDKCSWDLQH